MLLPRYQDDSRSLLLLPLVLIVVVAAESSTTLGRPPVRHQVRGRLFLHHSHGTASSASATGAAAAAAAARGKGWLLPRGPPFGLSKTVLLATTAEYEKSPILTIARLRGGGSDADSRNSDNDNEGDASSSDEEEEEDEASDAVDESDDDDVDDDESTTQPSPASSEPPKPISVTIKTATGSKLLDQSIELPTVTRTRDVASLKKSVSRLLPSRPPIAAIQLTLDGKILEDDTVVEDLVDEEEEDEDDDEEGEGLVLQLDMLPTVDPKFGADLETKIPDMTTAELLEAYTINEAAVYQNSVLLMKEKEKQQHRSEAGSEDEDEGEQLERPAADAAPQPVSSHIREQAARIRQNLESTLLQTSHAQQLLADPLPPLSAAQKQRSAVVEVKGQRVRQPGTTGGVQGGWKRAIQHNLNVNWAVTIRHFLLFLFFGYFGGRTASSRAILLLGAPSVFVLQFRPVKLLLRQMAFAVMDHPPSILLSLLPAPQQTILSLNVNEAIDAIYGEHIVGSTSVRQEEETEDDVASLVDFDDEEEEEEYDSEDEYDEDDSDDDY